jgi:DNA-binding Lrp family transcriptional regulator
MDRLNEDTMLRQTDLELIKHLRTGRRNKVTEISKSMNIPVTTLYDRLDVLDERFGIHHTALVDFSKIGFKSNVHMGFKVGINDKESFQGFLETHPALNSLYRVNHGYDFLAHLVFKDIDEMKIFLDTANSRFNILSTQVFDVVDEIKKEAFLSR